MSAWLTWLLDQRPRYHGTRDFSKRRQRQPSAATLRSTLSFFACFGLRVLVSLQWSSIGRGCRSFCGFGPSERKRAITSKAFMKYRMVCNIFLCFIQSFLNQECFLYMASHEVLVLGHIEAWTGKGLRIAGDTRWGSLPRSYGVCVDIVQSSTRSAGVSQMVCMLIYLSHIERGVGGVGKNLFTRQTRY